MIDTGFRDYTDAAELLKAGKRFVIGGHPMMDGDAIGSLYALFHTLTDAGRECLAVTQDVGLGKYQYLDGSMTLTPLSELPETLDGYDTAIIVDCGAESRARAILDRLAPGTKIVNLDHHIDNPGFGDAAVVHPDASSSGEVVYKVLKEAGIPLNHAAAEAIFTAIVTDTGRFSFSNSTPDSYRIIAELIEQFELDVAVLTGRIYRSKTPNRLKLEAMVAQGIETRLEGKVVIARVSRQMLDDTGCSEAEANEMIIIPKALKGGMISILFREMAPDHVKVSLRSEGQMAVNDIAAKFRGGGHLRAAGCQVYGRPVADSEADIIQAVVDALEKTLAETGGTIVV
ncbi:MAG: bifunctional oligoribonuclease/PAP phosphatase NrnA [Planctomycetes bacterium]|nr:bifunctional oligoribonuclease/PAP phosphatase NrnA [Planctomycetota bacterium]